MKKTPFIQKILSALAVITFVSLSGNMAFAGENINFPGTELDDGNLIPSGPSDNTVTILVTTRVINNVYGGWSLEAASTGNTVTILGGGIKGDVYGGYSEKGSATKNTVTISGGHIGGVVCGGWTHSGTATGNSVTILGGEISKFVFGGYSEKGEATKNTVTISGGNIGREVYGGWAFEAAATDNTITISGGDISGNVYGGWSLEAASTGNTVTILGGGIKGDVYGGGSGKGSATKNTVTISGGHIGGVVCGGGTHSGTATGNSVTILGGNIEWDVYGGRSSDGSATGNSVTISNGTIRLSVYGGWSEGEAMGNSVTISGGKIGGDVYGGWAFDAVATKNTVTISGGEIGGSVYGGFSKWGATATNNTVILDSGAGLSASSSIFGGFSENTASDIFTGNKLVLNDFQGTVKQISNFEFVEINSSGKEGDMLTLVGDDPTDLSKTKLNITFTGISRQVNVGDKINLIKNDFGITMGDETLQQEGQQQLKSTVYIYDLLFGSDENTIRATVASKKFNERSKALAEGRVASMAHLNMGADLIASQGMAQALDSDQAKGKIHLFSAMAATDSQYDTGSHINLYGYSALVGASISPAALPSLNFGLFGESGWGHYGSFSDFEDGAVRGAGSTQYYGGGLLTHYDFTKSGIRGLSVEASFRTGKTDADYQSGDLPNSKYDLSTPYYGAHAGVNYTRELRAKLKIANYARFLWSHLDGDNTSIEGSDFRFRTMDSQRIKAGSRVFYEIAPRITPYAGLSYEWECSGTARAVVDRVNDIAAPSLRGGTGTGELGAVWKPMAHQAFWVDFSAQGHVGERQGVSGVVRLRAEF